MTSLLRHLSNSLTPSSEYQRMALVNLHVNAVNMIKLDSRIHFEFEVLFDWMILIGQHIDQSEVIFPV